MCDAEIRRSHYDIELRNEKIYRSDSQISARGAAERNGIPLSFSLTSPYIYFDYAERPRDLFFRLDILAGHDSIRYCLYKKKIKKKE